MTYDLTAIKNSLTIEQVSELVAALGGNPQPAMGDILHCKTICHNGGSQKLYYYDNTKLFKCFTDCGCTFDIFELVSKVKSLEFGIEWSLAKAITWVADYFGIAGIIAEEEDKIEDWKIFERYDRIKNIDKDKKVVELKEYESGFLKNLPRPRISEWEAEGITKESMDYFGICYEPKNECIVIPHHDKNGYVVGIRQRTMIKELADKYGKYRPLKMGKILYNHALSFNLYGLYQNQDNIKKAGKAIVLESEKSVLQYESMFGRENNIAVACCGSSFIAYQCQLLIETGAREITIAFDRQFQELNDKEHIKLVKNLKNIHKKYGQFVTISYIFDLNMITPYKASPTDCGKEIFLELYRNRVNLY